jgi:hypothetical protein
VTFSRTYMPDLTVEQICLAAFALGQTLDLEDCIYGPNTKAKNGFLGHGLSYYRLLAGLAAMIDARTVVEIGTHFGGSTRALWRGMNYTGGAGKLLTVDIEDISCPALRELDGLQVLIGDAADKRVLAELVQRVRGDTVDLVFLDGKKDAVFVETILQHLLSRLEVRWLVIDDVRDRSTLHVFWHHAESIWKSDAFEVSQRHPEIRDQQYGMGVIRLSPASIKTFLTLG